MVFRRTGRKLKETARKIEKAQDELVEDVRRLLPAGRGGFAPRTGEVDLTETRLKERVPLQKIRVPTVLPTNPGSGFRRSAEIRPKLTQQMPGEVEMINTPEIIRELVNNPMIQITEDMLEVINDPGIMMDENFDLTRQILQDQFRADKLMKPKRKVSKYQKELGRQLKMLKKKHPRTRVTALMKRAHRATRKALK